VSAKLAGIMMKVPACGRPQGPFQHYPHLTDPLRVAYVLYGRPLNRKQLHWRCRPV